MTLPLLNSIGIVVMAMVVPTFKYGIHIVTIQSTVATNNDTAFLIPNDIPSERTPITVIFFCVYIIVFFKVYNSMYNLILLSSPIRTDPVRHHTE